MHPRVLASCILLPLLACRSSGGEPEQRAGIEAAGGSVGSRRAPHDDRAPPPAAPPPPRYGPGELASTCALLTADMVAESLAVNAELLERAGGQRTYCRYAWGEGNVVSMWAVRVHDSVPAARTSFDHARRGVPAPELEVGAEARPVDGIGDAASWKRGRLSVLVSNAEITIEVQIEGKASTPEQAVALARRVVAALP